MIFAIAIRYFISNDYDSTLPGLDSTIARKFFISAHMGLGLVCLVLYPLQFFLCIRKRFPSFHRWSGRLSLFSAVFTSLFGMTFIFLKRFRLVGGINMGIAFFVYGLVLGSCAIFTFYYAWKQEFRLHRYWAIRSYSQILATMLYRYFYALLIGLGAIHKPDDQLECDENDVCSYFLRPFDVVHAWTFFLFPLLVAEITIYLMNDESGVGPVGEITDRDYIPNQDEVAVEDCRNHEYIALQENEDNGDTLDIIPRTNHTNTDDSGNGATYFYLNSVGILFATISLGSTLLIFVMSALDEIH